MSQIISFENYQPAPRYDNVAWTEARVEEAAAATGPWTVIDTIALEPVDADPTTPASRSFTTENGTDTPNLWYRVLFADDADGVSAPTAPLQNLSVLDPARLYVTAAELEESLRATGSSFTDGEVANAIESASRGIELICRRRFWLDPESVTRAYTPEPPALLEIDDLTVADDITVTLDGVELTVDTDYVLLPLNAPADSRPYERIRLLARHPAGFADGALTVEGRFGWPQVDGNVRAAARLLATKIAVRFRLAPLAIFSVDGGQAMRLAQNDPDVMGLLRTYARLRTQSLQLG